VVNVSKDDPCVNIGRGIFFVPGDVGEVVYFSRDSIFRSADNVNVVVVFSPGFEDLFPSLLQAHLASRDHLRHASETAIDIGYNREVRTPDLLEEDGPAAFYLQGQDANPELYADIISPDVLVENPELGDFERSNTPVGCIFPAHLMSISWFGVLWLSLQPISTNELRVDWGVLGPVKGLPLNAESYDEYVFPNWIGAVNNEDKPRVEAVQVGAKSGYAEIGPLHKSYENTIREFIGYLSRQLRA
jgi:hypothetical protein